MEGGLYINNKEVNLSNITCDVFLIAGGKDNITTSKQVFNMENFVSGEVEKYYIEDSGHIGVFVSKNAMEYWEVIESKMS